MPTIVNKAIYLNDATLTFGADDYTFGTSAAALVPTVTVDSFVDIGGNVQQRASKPVWAFNVTHAQDWETASSLSKFLQANQGTIVPATLKASDGSDVATFDVVIVPGQYGGTAAEIIQSTVALPVNGQPAIAPGA